MSILVNRDSKVICQGFTGQQGTFHSEQCIDYGTQLVGGVTPGGAADAPGPTRVQHGQRRGGRDRRRCEHDLCAGAVRRRCDPRGRRCRDRLVVCITEGIPVMDMVRVKARCANAIAA